MKRILLSFVLATVSAAILSSCTKEYYETYYDTVPSKTMVYERSASSWQNTSDPARKYVDLPVQELTQYYLNQGIVTVAMSVDNEESYQAIPATIDAISFSYDYVVGSVRIYAEDPLMGAAISVPANAVFKVSLTEADWVE